VAQDLEQLLGRYRRGARGQRDQRLLKDYGINEATYEALLRSQGGVCAICHEGESRVGPFGQTEPLCVDHDHATGRVRGLLCNGCNAGIGSLGDDSNRLRAAATYLDHGGSAGQQHQPRRR
jgi:hypothetical protein